MKAAIIYTALLGVILWASYHIAGWAKIRDEQRRKYEALYKHIQNSIRDDNQKLWKEYVRNSLKMLKDLPYQNAEATDVLMREYLKKYYNGREV
jgi:beta-mannanase